MDPDSYKEAKLGSAHGDSEPDIDDATEGQKEEEKDEGVDDDDDAKEWDYIRVNGLGFVPGLCCPHHDRVQSNGVLRATDFDDMMLRHPTEVGGDVFFCVCSLLIYRGCRLTPTLVRRRSFVSPPFSQVGICIDHNAAFVIDESSYRVLRPTSEDLPGSVSSDGSFSDERLGKPGVWIKEVLRDGCTLRVRQCPDSGSLSELLRVPDDIVPSVRHMKLASDANPDDGPMRMSYPGFAAKNYFGGSVAVNYMDALAESDDDDEEAATVAAEKRGSGGGAAGAAAARGEEALRSRRWWRRGGR
jgi:hypothetical protein